MNAGSSSVGIDVDTRRGKEEAAEDCVESELFNDGIEPWEDANDALRKLCVWYIRCGTCAPFSLSEWPSLDSVVGEADRIWS
jgi:hypothetical protein